MAAQGFFTLTCATDGAVMDAWSLEIDFETAPGTTLAAVEIVWKRKDLWEAAVESGNDVGAVPEARKASTTGGEITITDAAAWEFSVDAETINMPGALYVFDIKTTDSDGTVKRYVRGEQLINPKVG